MDKSQLLAFLKEQMNMLKDKLATSTNIIGNGYRINSGAWANDSGFCVAFLSCIRQPHEESIDLTMDVTIEKKTITFSKAIYWSDGNIIQDLGTVELPWTEPRDARDNIGIFFNQLIENDLKIYSDFVLQQKDNLD